MFNLNLSCCKLLPLLLLLSAMGMENRFLPSSLQQLFMCLKASVLCPVWLVFFKLSHPSLFISTEVLLVSSPAMTLQIAYGWFASFSKYISQVSMLYFISLRKPWRCEVLQSGRILRSAEWGGKKLHLCACLWTSSPITGDVMYPSLMPLATCVEQGGYVLHFTPLQNRF